MLMKLDSGTRALQVSQRASELFEVAKGIRQNFLGTELSPAILRSITRELFFFRDMDSVAVFLDDCERSILEGKPNFSSCRQQAYSSIDPIIISFFSAPYNKKLFFEVLLTSDLDVDPVLKSKFPACAKMISVHAATGGFSGINDITIFPENFLTTDPIMESDPAIYFINRFSERFRAQGLPLIQKFTQAEISSSISKVNEEEVNSLFLYWLHLHEHFHRTGPLPLPTFLELKRSRSTAAFEELRVDISTILTLHDLKLAGSCASLFVFLERLLRYASLSHPNDNFDARSGQMLLSYLESKNFIEIVPSGVVFDFSQVIEGLRELMGTMDKLELLVADKPLEVKKARLTELVQQIARFDPSDRKFHRHALFEATAKFSQQIEKGIAIDSFFDERCFSPNVLDAEKSITNWSKPERLFA